MANTTNNNTSSSSSSSSLSSSNGNSSSSSSSNGRRRPHAVVFPFPAQGHMIPLLDLAHVLSLRYGFVVTVVVTPLNLPLLGPFLSATPAAAPLVLPLPGGGGGPGRAEHVRHLPSPSSAPSLIRALSLLRPAVLSWARTLDPARPPVSLVVSDFFLGWTHHLAADLAVPRLAFFSSGAFADSLIQHLWLHPPSAADGDPHSFPSLPTAPSFPYAHLPSLNRGYRRGDPDWEFARDSLLANALCWGAAINTFHALEGPFLDHLRRSGALGRRVWAVGPLKPTGPPGARGGASSVPAAELAAWLAACPPRSVVYVCFGSQYAPSEAQARAVAAALRLSGARFVWALGGSSASAGLEEEEEETMGLVVRGWAPQAELLGHGAVGAFLTHCGWNSALEAVAGAAAAVMLAWPMQAEQFVNARLLVEGLGVAVRVAEGAAAVPDPAALARTMAEAVAEDDRGWAAEVRARAAELRRSAEKAVAEGGSSHADLEDMIREIRDLDLPLPAAAATTAAPR
ncbi:UDP-glycosyltransferase 89B1-like isoform X2 [Ananas comosus]|uniref:UDP-glycosyltransferase 89B1-like isoform X2 n=1 Tax=Ananas comosus TaxID=4615 RepID=A0A6P5EL76_ANACO|nr:UDP-glycosyltransferase 89B1-like isoform X2 [Ananas comosus]